MQKQGPCCLVDEPCSGLDSWNLTIVNCCVTYDSMFSRDFDAEHCAVTCVRC